METKKFEKLIQAITAREFKIHTEDENIIFGKEYWIYKKLPITERKISFKWVAPTVDDKILRSFITAFTTRYKEPNPDSYNYEYGGKMYKWEEKSEIEKEYAYSHHASHMYSKSDLLKQVEANFNSQEIETTLNKYGFYTTEYGIGIFVVYYNQYVQKAIDNMAKYLNSVSIPFKNEFSDARWVLRFKLNLTKESHNNILKNFQ